MKMPSWPLQKSCCPGQVFNFRLRLSVGSTECPGPETLNATIHSMRIEIMETLLDHVIITVKDLDRSIAFYETALKPLGIVQAMPTRGLRTSALSPRAKPR